MGYGSPPWTFAGHALYQLSLVRVEEARKFVPPELPLVSLFGWTLGGFYLARYSASPVGPFEELVALAGLVWDFPTSCAWAARVYVNNRAARDHGIAHVGLPSRLAGFKAQRLPELRGGGAGGAGAKKGRTWWDAAAPGGGVSGAGGEEGTAAMEVANLEPRGRGRGLRSALCSLEMPAVPSAWAPRIQLVLPSFAGATPEYPGLLKYSLRLLTHVRFLQPVALRLPAERPAEDRAGGEALDAVLGGRPLLCMAFEGMEMEVQPPRAWAPPQGRPLSAVRMRGAQA